jgi:hypothetical protein
MGRPNTRDQGWHPRSNLAQNKATYFCTSTFPNVSDSINISSSSGFAEKANNIARMSSMPYLLVSSMSNYPAIPPRPTGSVSMMILFGAIVSFNFADSRKGYGSRIDLC